jgi:hypothetical protein
LDFDTGSADLWLFSTQLAASSQQGHTVYDSKKSSTFKNMTGSTWTISYGDGSGASGNVGTDTVNIGGAIVQNQVIELATTVSSEFISDLACDGLVGLAYSGLNQVKPTQAKTFFDNVKPSLSQPIFAADLKAGGGQFNFGYINSAAYKGSLTYASVLTNTGFWQFQPTSYVVGSSTVAGNGITAVADTGTSIILLPSSLATTYWNQVTGATYASGIWTFPCSSTLPNFGFVVGGTTLTVQGSLMNYASIGGGRCFGAIQSIGNTNYMILGDTMFKAQYVAFNLGTNQIGFAPHA